MSGVASFTSNRQFHWTGEKKKKNALFLNFALAFAVDFVYLERTNTLWTS